MDRMMDKRGIKSFLKEHPLDNMSVAVLAFFQIENLFHEELHSFIDNTIEDLSNSAGEEDRTELLLQERKEIEKIDDVDTLIAKMRKLKFMDNRVALCRRAIEMENIAAVPIIEKLKRNRFDKFIEVAVLAISHMEEKYVDILLDGFGDIGWGYARAQASLIFGYRGYKEATELLLKLYDELSEGGLGYEQCPLYSLHVLYGD